jgi:hypothetical protein
LEVFGCAKRLKKLFMPTIHFPRFRDPIDLVRLFLCPCASVCLVLLAVLFYLEKTCDLRWRFFTFVCSLVRCQSKMKQRDKRVLEIDQKVRSRCCFLFHFSSDDFILQEDDLGRPSKKAKLETEPSLSTVSVLASFIPVLDVCNVIVDYQGLDLFTFAL